MNTPWPWPFPTYNGIPVRPPAPKPFDLSKVPPAPF